MARPPALPFDSIERPQGWGLLLLVAACVANLPLVYLFIANAAPPAAVLLAGFLAMGLGWSAGLYLEGRRLRLARTIIAVGIAAGAAALHPLVAAVGGGAYVLAGAALSLCALVLLWSRRPVPRTRRWKKAKAPSDGREVRAGDE